MVLDVYIIILVVISLGIFYFLLKRVIIPLVMIRKAKSFLYKSLFPLGEVQKKMVIKEFHKITANKYTDNQAIDYFIKEKGLQLMSITPGTPLRIKYYLARPTLVKLTYFERVEFHKTFINYKGTKIFSHASSNVKDL